MVRNGAGVMMRGMCLTTKSVEGTALALEGIDNVEGCDRLALGVLSVGDCVTDDPSQKVSEHISRVTEDASEDRSREGHPWRSHLHWARSARPSHPSTLSMPSSARAVPSTDWWLSTFLSSSPPRHFGPSNRRICFHRYSAGIPLLASIRTYATFDSSRLVVWGWQSSILFTGGSASRLGISLPTFVIGISAQPIQLLLLPVLDSNFPLAVYKPFDRSTQSFWVSDGLASCLREGLAVELLHVVTISRGHVVRVWRVLWWWWRKDGNYYSLPGFYPGVGFGAWSGVWMFLRINRLWHLLHANGMNKLHIMIWPYLLWNLPLHISIPYHTRHSPCACLFPHCLTIIWNLVYSLWPNQYPYKRENIVQTATSRSLIKEITLIRAYLRQAPRFSARFTILGLDC